MDSQRWRQVEQLYHETLAIEPEQRSRFLREACGDDQELCQEVESLLAWDRAASGDILDQPVWADGVATRTAETQVQPGSQLGPYRIQALLGEGGMGRVYQGEDRLLHRLVAIKTLSNVSGASAQTRLRFLEEARAASSLNHPNIVQIYELRSDASQDFIVMEFVRGRTLTEILAGRSLSTDEVLGYAEQIVSALSAAHSAGIVHRDIKPGNIVVTDTGVVKVIDFGLAKRLESAPESGTKPRTSAGVVMGTALYMSPEQAEGRPVDARSDIFSFGAVLYEMLTGRRAFDGGSAATTRSRILHDEPVPMRAFRRDVPHGLAKAVDRCLRKDPAQRYPSGRELADALSSLRPARVAGASRLLRMLLSVGLAAALAGSGWLAYRGSRARWVRNEATPQIQKLLWKDDYSAAFDSTLR